MIPQVLICYHARPMCVGLFIAAAFRQVGCRVRTAGPSTNNVYDDDLPEAHRHSWPDDFVDTDFHLPNEPRDARAALDTIGQPFDLVVMVDQYDHFYLTGDLGGRPPLVWIAVENWNDEQAGRAQRRVADLEFHMIRHDSNGQHPNPPLAAARTGQVSEFMAFGYDPHVHPSIPLPERPISVVQVGSPYEPRPTVWNAIRSSLDQAPPAADYAYRRGLVTTAHTAFGRAWSYREMAWTYNRALTTLSNSGCDFLPMRIFEAMAMGTVLISDRQPILERFIGPPWSPERPGFWFEHDGTPDGQVRAVHQALSDPQRLYQMSGNAHLLAARYHTYAHRARLILEKLGFDAPCRMVVD